MVLACVELMVVSIWKLKISMIMIRQIVFHKQTHCNSGLNKHTPACHKFLVETTNLVEHWKKDVAGIEAHGKNAGASGERHPCHQSNVM